MKTKLFSFLCCFLLMALLAGCGGGGGSDSASTPTTTTSTTGTVSGTVSLPANTNAKLFDVKLPLYARLFASPAYAAAITDLTTLTVKIGSATTNPNAIGAYTLTVTAGSNLDLTVTAPSGNVVLEAIIPSVTAGSSTSQSVDSTSTAVALIYKQNTSLTISQISSSSAVTNVKTAIETALTDPNNAVSITSNPTVTTAATTAATSISSPTPVLTTISLSPSSATVISGATQTFTAKGLDQNGNEISFTPSFSLSSSDIGSITTSGQMATFTAKTKGTGTLTVTSGSITASASITVTTGALNSLVISPTTVTLYKGDTQQFSVYGVDASGNAKERKFIAVSPTWSVTGSIGTIDSNGLFTASAKGTGQVKAEAAKSDGTQTSITSDVTVLNRNPSVSSVVAASSNLVTGGSTTITATASDPDNDTLSYSWSATDGTVSGTGASITYNAPSISGAYTISVIVSDGLGGSANGSVNITVSTPKTVVSIAGGEFHNCAVLSNGSMKCWGTNSSGQLGDGTYTNSSTPVLVSGINNATTIVAGTSHSCASLSDGSVKCWGHNGDGQLGSTTTCCSSNVPVNVTGISDAMSISAGGTGSCAALQGGSVSCWGANGYGAFGNGIATQSTTPVVISGISNAKTVSKGGFHACALLIDGSIKCWGDNRFGQLGNGNNTGSDVPVTVSGITNAIHLSTGYEHTCAVLSDGAIKCWGDNSFGQLGLGSYTGPNNCSYGSYSGYYCSFSPVSVTGAIGNAAETAAGYLHTCARLSDGSAVCWGENGNGQLGNGNTTDSTSPVIVSGVSATSQISSGWKHTCVILADGTAKCWGRLSLDNSLYVVSPFFKYPFYVFADFLKDNFWRWL